MNPYKQRSWPRALDHVILKRRRLWIYSMFAMICGLSIACTTVVYESTDMGAGGETGGGGLSGMTAGYLTGGTPSGEVPIIPDECEIGQQIGLCAECAPTFTPVALLNDPQCPYIPCETLIRYQVMTNDEGGRSCLQYLAEQPPNNCKEIGVCYEDPAEACVVSETPTTLFTVYPGCGDFTGCEGAVSPDASIKGEGEACHSIGTCSAEGRCSAPPSCEGGKPDYVVGHCPDPDDPSGSAGCDLRVDLNTVDNADDISCTLVCATQNGCVTGFEVSGDCGRGREIGCGDRKRQLICRCNGN